MDQADTTLLAEVIACRHIVEDYANRLDRACVVHVETGKTLFPDLSRAEDEYINQQCIRVLSQLTLRMPDAMSQWKSIKAPSNQNLRGVEFICAYWVPRRNLFQMIEYTLRYKLESEYRNKIDGSHPVTPTQYSPPNGSIIINSPSNSNVQVSQNSPYSNQVINIPESKYHDILEIINEIESKRIEIGLDKPENQRIKSDLDTIKTQISSPSPRNNIINECWPAVKDFATKVGANVLSNIIWVKLQGL